MPMFSSLVAVLAVAQLSGAAAFRQKSREGSSTKHIAGVPVYNYHLAYKGSREAGSAQGLLEVDEEGASPLAVNWILVLKQGISNAILNKICEKDPSHKRCTPAGHPDEGGVPFVDIHGTEEDLEEILTGQQANVDFLEPDLVTHIMEPTKSIMPHLADSAKDEGLQNVSSAKLITATSSASWGLSRIGAGTTSAKGSGVHIYVLDTGIRTSHSDFGNRASSALEVTSNTPQECRGSTSCAVDRQGHGTHCAGSAAGSSYGVAPEATVHAVKVLGDDGSGQNSWTLSALDWIISKGQRPAVASMSLGSSGTSRAEKVAIDAATKAGITVVVAAGNENDDACKFTPAFVPSAITVGATDSRNRRASYSCFGRCVDIWAPGSDIASAGHMSDYSSATMSGTSMACPHVSGAAALILGQNPSMSATEVRAALLAGAEKNAITGLTSADTNLFLSVSDLPGGQPGPVPAPAPKPTPPPVTGSCPASAVNSYPDLDGDCQCAPNSYCYNGWFRGCPYSRSGYRSSVHFSSSCTSCRCLLR